MRRLHLLLLVGLSCTQAAPDPTDDETPADTEPAVDTDTDADSDSGPVAGTADTGPDTDGVPLSFCAAWSDCPGDEICDLSLGRCEERTVWTESQAAVFDFHPRAAAPGDLLVIDGKRFWGNLLLQNSVRVRVGGRRVDRLAGVDPDSTRLLVPVTEGMSGAVEVVTDNQGTVTLRAQLGVAPEGIVPCDATSPPATGLAGATVDDVGPYGAGYVDLTTPRARVVYPADCGGVRRPPTPGRYPLIGILQGEGLGFVQYEYLAQRLATWGMLVVVPMIDATEDEPSEAREIAELQALFATLRGVDLGSFAPELADVETTSTLAWIGHGVGASRIQAVTRGSEALRDATVASVVMGPIDLTQPLPGPLLLFQATQDQQAFAFTTNAAWNRQPAPKWRVTIEGGNHSLYTDHRVWSGLLDGRPSVSRRLQLRAVTSYVLPLLQRVFGVGGLFDDRLDTPPTEPNLTVEVVAEDPPSPP